MYRITKSLTTIVPCVELIPHKAKLTKSMIRIISLVLIIFFAVSCGEKNQLENDNPFSSFLNNLEYIEPRESLMIDEVTSSVYGPLRLAVDNFGRPVVVDHSNWSLHLLDVDGEPISTAGGIGRGPGEFAGINYLGIGPDQKLYVLDKKLKRVTVYSILDDSLNFETVLSLPDFSPYTIETFHFSENTGYVGVFTTLRRKLGEPAPFHIYQLNENLTLNQELFQIPGNETIEMMGVVQDNEFGFNTHWKMSNDQFHYAHSDNFSFYSVDMGDLMEEENTASGIPARENDSEAQEFLTDHLRPLTQAYPSMEEEILEREDIPYFSGFTTSNEYTYFTIFNVSTDPGIVLQMNNETQALKAIRVPSRFQMYAVHENKIYGIDHSSSESHIVIISLDT